MLWLIPVLLSFDIIEAIVPVIIILVLIAAAAGLTRGTDIFALFGLGTIMGFANAGSGRVGKGLKGTRYGADSIKRGRAAGKAKKGLIKKAKKAKANYAQARAKAPAARNRLRMRSASKANNRLKKLQKMGLGKSQKAKKLQAKLNKIKATNIANYNAKKVADRMVSNPSSGMAAAGLAGGMAISEASKKRLEGGKISGRAKTLNKRIEEQKKYEKDKKGEHMVNGIYTSNGITDFDKIPTTKRNVSISEKGMRIGHVPKFNNYVKTVKTKNSTPLNSQKNSEPKFFLNHEKTTNPGKVVSTKVLKIPKSALFQKGGTSAIAMSFLQRRWAKQIEAGGPHAERAQGRLNKLNDVVAQLHYGKSSANEAFDLAQRGQLRSKNAGRLNDIVSIGIPIPGARQIGKALGKHYNQDKLERLEHETYLNYLDRKNGYDKLKAEMSASEDHTIRHPISGKHGSTSLEAKRKKVWIDAYNEALKGLKK